MKVNCCRRLPIIAFAPHPWDEPQWMNRQHLLSRLAARGWHIIYSTGALSLWDRGGSKWRAAPWQGYCRSADGVLIDCPGRWLPRWPRSDGWDRYALDFHSRRLVSTVGALDGRGIVFLFHPVFWPYVERLRLRYVAFHVYDDYALQPAMVSDQESMRAALISRADLLTCSIGSLAAALPEPGPHKARILLNGADSRAFIAGATLPCPEDLAAIPLPRIHYAGSINRKVDLPLVAAIANRRPDWHWVLVGKVEDSDLCSDPVSREGYAACLALSNVHFLGLKDRREIPAYTFHSSVNVMCYRVRGGWWTHAYPLKLHEYLGAGRPVVSSNMENMRCLSNVIAFAEDVESWLAALERAIAGNGAGSPELRRQVAMTNSWEHRVDQLDRWLLETIESSE